MRTGDLIGGHEDLREAYRDDRVAQQYVRRRFSEPLGALLHARQRAYLRQALAAFQPGDVLEVAPGPARLTVDVDVRRGTVIDASLQMLQEARHRLSSRGTSRWRLVQGDVFQLPFRASFDLIYTFRLIRHFEQDERRKIYRQLAAALRPGGRLIFDAVNEAVSAALRRHAAPGAYQHYDALLRPEQIESELRESGFDDVALTGIQHRYQLQRQVQILVAPRSAPLARLTMELLDRTGGEPLEWIVSCRRFA